MICYQQAYATLAACLIIVSVIMTLAFIFFEQNTKAVLIAFVLACLEVILMIGLLLNVFASICPV